MTKIKEKARKGFRKNKRVNHPAYLIDVEGNLYKYIGITHSLNTDNVDNVPLKQNPNPFDTKPAFVRPFVEKDEPKNFGRRYKNWEFSNEDKLTVEKIIDKNNKKHKK